MPQDMLKAFKPRYHISSNAYFHCVITAYIYTASIMKSMKLLIKTRCLKILIQNMVQK